MHSYLYCKRPKPTWFTCKNRKWYLWKTHDNVLPSVQKLFLQATDHSQLRPHAKDTPRLPLGSFRNHPNDVTVRYATNYCTSNGRLAMLHKRFLLARTPSVLMLIKYWSRTPMYHVSYRTGGWDGTVRAPCTGMDPTAWNKLHTWKAQQNNALCCTSPVWFAICLGSLQVTGSFQCHV